MGSSADDATPKLQDPDEALKPEVDSTRIPGLVERLYGFKTTEVKSLPSYDDLNFYFRADPGTCENAHETRVNPEGYVLKVLNSLQSSSPVIIDAQNAFCEHVRQRGIPTQVPVTNKQGNVYSLETFSSEDGSKTFGPYLVRVVTFVPGTIFYETPYVPGSFYNVGTLVGRLHNAIEDGSFHHRFYDTYTTIWSLTEVTSLRNFLQAVTDQNDLRMVKEVIDNFETDVLPLFKNFAKGMIHGDINEQNLIMTEVPGQDEIPRDQRVHDVTALLDFADSTQSYFILDLAIAICYFSIECPESRQLDVGGHVLAGYMKFRTVNDSEFASLKTLVSSRLCQSLVYGAHAYMLQPGNEYLLTTSKKGWPLLRKIWRENKDDLHARWRAVIKSYNK